MLTSEQITQLRTQAGLPPTPAPQGTDNIISQRKVALGMQVTPTKTPSLGENYMSNVSPAAQDVMGKGNIGAAAEDFRSGNILKGVEEGALGTASDAVQAIFSPIAAPIQSMIQASQKYHAENPDAKVPGAISSPEIDSAKKTISDWMQQHPTIAKTLGDAFNVGTAVIGGSALEKPVSEVVSGIKNTVSNISQAASSAKEAVAGRVASVFKGKTPEEILATPENQLQKLSSEDRKVFFDTQREQAKATHDVAQDTINKKSSELEKNINAESERKITDLNNETQGLVNQVDRASIEEAQSLKPKVIQAMGKNSQTYRDLIEKEISPVRDEQVAHTDLWKYITDRNLDNPTRGTEIANRLGLTEGKTSTIGEIYDQIKGLRQDLGKAGTKGSRTFTPDEMKINDSISTLSDYLKNEKGIDFTKANKFWSQYAPLRDKLIKTVQPFTPRGAESGTFTTFSKDIQNYVNGIKEGKADFIQATEKLLGTKIGNAATRDALEKLTANQKAKFAEKLEQENKLSDAKLLREQQMKDAKGELSSAQKQIADKEFEANRKAQTRANVWKTLKWVTGGLIGIEELKRLTGI